MLLLAGPTASGKTDAALAVARAFDAVVVSADAMQVYRGMDVGTGKVSAELRAEVRHFGIDVVDPDEPFDASRFVALADEVIASYPRVVVAGGTSLYLRSLVQGLVETPPVDPELRAEIEGLPDLHGALREVDPALAERLHPNDRVRIVRGLEVYRQTGLRLSEMHQVHQTQQRERHPHRGLWLDRDPDVLDARIDARVQQMMREGYREEVERLLSEGYSRELKPMMSLGYRHLCDHLLDGVAIEEALRRTQRDTRRFARKQRTWMRQLGYRLVGAGEGGEILREAEGLWR